MRAYRGGEPVALEELPNSSERGIRRNRVARSELEGAEGEPTATGREHDPSRGVIVAPDLDEPARPHRGSTRLRRILIELDALALLTAWIPLFVGHSASHAAGRSAQLIAVGATTVLCLVLASMWRLYRARVCNVRRIERALLFRLAVTSAIAGGLLLTLFGHRPSDFSLLGTGSLTFVLLIFERSTYRGWLHAQRRRGRFTRPTLVLGTNDEAIRWCKLLGEYPDLGIEVRGLVGEDNPGIEEAGMHWLGTSDRLAEIAETEHAVSTLVIVTAFEQSALNRITRSALRAGLHVEMSTGLQGIAGDRLRWAPASRESLVYLEHRALSKGALGVKRAFDIVIGSLGLILTWPVIAIAAILIRCGDGGPAVFRQLRVGRGGKVFTLYKLRSMKPNAEAIKRELIAQNFRDGPLFKMVDDPRVTPIGRLLRLSSIDELPQLVNVLQGHMSIVGPRPALPEEVEQFDDDLLARHDVLPGITGLWQLDARDHLSFDSYQRLDIHYVENWSIGLDITIFAGTIVSIIRRLWKKGTA